MLARWGGAGAEALGDALLELAPDAVDPDAQRIHRDVQILRERLAAADVVVFLMVAQDESALVVRQPLEAVAEAGEPVVFLLFVACRRSRLPILPLQGRALAGDTPGHLLGDEMGHSAEVAVGICHMDLRSFLKAPGDPVHGFVGQILGMAEAAPLEEADQPAADHLVFDGGLIAVRVEKAEECFEAFWRHFHSPCKEKPAR